MVRLTIPVQEIRTPKRFELAERFSFSPGNALVAHKPIGGLNRARQVVYRELSEFRHGRDGADLVEPTPESDLD